MDIIAINRAAMALHRWSMVHLDLDLLVRLRFLAMGRFWVIAFPAANILNFYNICNNMQNKHKKPGSENFLEK